MVQGDGPLIIEIDTDDLKWGVGWIIWLLFCGGIGGLIGWIIHG